MHGNTIRMVCAVALPALMACGGERPATEVTAEPAAGKKLVVALTGTTIVGQPRADAARVREIAAGDVLTLLDLVAEGASWARVSTWDDRVGWAPAENLIDEAVWSHYQAALGGTPPSGLRATYPVAGGSWAAEAPFHSPGYTPVSSIWLLREVPTQTHVASIDTLDNTCGRERFRFALLPEASGSDVLPDLDRAVLSLPSGQAPTLRRLEVGPAGASDPGLREAALSAVTAASNGAAAPSAGEPDPPAGDPEITYLAVGDQAYWAALSWSVEEGTWGVGALLQESDGAWRSRLVVRPTFTTRRGAPPPRPVAAYSTPAADRPTLLVVKVLSLAKEHVDLYIARATDYRRLRGGFEWGCQDGAHVP